MTRRRRPRNRESAATEIQQRSGRSPDCPHNPLGGNYACNGAGTFGHCDLQLDSDGDKVGDACDSCPNTATSNQITSNSNLDNEVRKGAPPLGDMCEPIPQLVTRANVGRIKYGTNTNLDPAASTPSHTTFLQSSGLGIGASMTAVDQTADLRYCHCVDAAGAEIDRETCFHGRCAPGDTPLNLATYAMMTTSVSTNLTAAPPIPLGFGATIGSTYTQSINCNDTFTHRPANDLCRLGTERLLRWEHSADVVRDPLAFPQYTDPEDPVEHTLGFVLSHVRTTIVTNVARDGIGSGSLRDTFEYVKTPLVRYVSTSANRTYVNCILAGCSMVFRPDWVIYPPDVARTQLTPIDDLNYFARISSQPDGAIGAVARPDDPVVDLASAMSTDILSLVSAPDWGFLTPVESGAVARARVDGGTRPFAVAISSPWRASSYRPWGVRVFEDGIMWLAPFRELPEPPPSASPFGPTRFVPADRDGAKPLYSAEALAVFLIGGHRPASGEPTREVWRYDLKSDTWQKELHNVLTDATIQDPLAVGFDASTERFAALDQVPGATTRRILRIDLKSKTVRVVAELPAYANAGRYSVVHVGDSEYFLLRQTQGDTRIDIFRFRLRSSSVDWLGRRVETGDLLDDAFATPVGVLAPISRQIQGDHDFIVVGTSPNTATPASL